MSQDQVRQFIDQATQSIQSGQFDGALQLIDQALALSPIEADAYILRGICLSQTGQPAAATDAFNRATALDPTSAKAKYNIGVHQYALGQKLEALKSAREALNLDPAHAGARQLVSNLETEISGPSDRTMSNPNDPLEMPPIPQTPPSSEPNPSANPYNAPAIPQETPTVEPAMPSPPPAGSLVPQGDLPPVSNPYMKQGYEQSAHSLPFVENLGSAWLGIGWALAAANLAGFIAIIILVVNVLGQVNPNDPEAVTRAVESQTGLLWFSRIAGFGTLVGIMIWSIMDLIDRRGNFVWLIPNIVCSCCGFGWLTLPIYILAGRNN